ncbi:two-component sensor histidine kinase [Streptomyces sp. SA15]|uniref:sensor histidine kinase n=1 Tax=Streptomyces sp. SA15 TaxID=934019 RepID=UPI000BB063E1|nr:sensor histidine kinase [Streptomyces sp. SA15]PAZ13925.1 two-component sensor histidine kinase [Streptomyces sp. SA15]
MPRVDDVTETGIQHGIGSRVLRGLRALRDDLWTLRPDPLPAVGRLRRLPHVVLFLPALGITIGGTAQLTDNGKLGFGLAFLIALAQGGAVLLALWRPIPAWWLSIAATVVGAVAVRGLLLSGATDDFTWPWAASGIIAHLLVLLLLALRVRTRVSVEALALTVLATYLLQGPLGAPDFQDTGVLAIALSAVVVVLGIALRGRREARAELGRQATLTAEERARRTLLEERNRIARELHDVVAHHMSVISIQAQVAPHLVDDPPEELKDNLAGIRQNALEALTELRHVLGVLRQENPDGPEPSHGSGTGTGTAPHAPQPTLDRLDALVANTRAAGLAVTVEVVGKRRSLPPGVELSAYRIVQEALSNVLRHAPGARVRVELAYLSGALNVKVVNSRPTQPAPQSPGAGHGLLGMRERATMLGGALHAGPAPGGGYQVSAYLPAAELSDGLDYTASGGIAVTGPVTDPVSTTDTVTHPALDQATDPKDDTA